MRLSLKFFTIVTPNTCKFIERFGRFHRRLDPGLHMLIPIYENVTQEISLKEFTKHLTGQEVITKDNINLEIDGILYCKVLDPLKTNYDVTDPEKAIEIMAQSLLRCEIGKISLDSVLHDRQKLNDKLLEEIKHYSDRWGMTCFRYEITNINIESAFSKFMNFEAESERFKRKLMLNANSIELTTHNNAQKERMVILNKKKADAKSIYYVLSAWTNRIKMLREIMEGKNGNIDLLEMKLKNDLVQSYEELGKGDKNVFLRKDISNMKDVFSSVDLKGIKADN